MAGMKGAYNYTDFNRIGEAISYLVERMKALAIYDDSIIPKVDWGGGRLAHAESDFQSSDLSDQTESQTQSTGKCPFCPWVYGLHDLSTGK